jgi:hypothetical protein
LNARLVAALALALSAGAALALPAVWLEPLHLDEAITIDYATRSYSAIVTDVLLDRGGAPLHFFVEHVTLANPGGIEGLRCPRSCSSSSRSSSQPSSPGNLPGRQPRS